MNHQLNETTLNLISLIDYYRQVSSSNKKMRCVITRSQLLKMRGIETSTTEEKLQFCSEAVEAIASIVIKTNIRVIKVRHIEPLLNRNEIDFIQEMISTDVWYESDLEPLSLSII